MGSIDTAYGKTPQEALEACLLKHYAFSNVDMEFLNGRPEFMDLEARDVHRHDWDQYDEEGPMPSNRSEGPTVSTRRVWDTPTSEEDRYCITINNVWCEVSANELHDDPLGERAHVRFQFSLQLRESALTGEDESRPGDDLWSCERMSTEWV